MRRQMQHIRVRRFRLETRFGGVGADANETVRAAIEAPEPFDFILGVRQRRERRGSKGDFAPARRVAGVVDVAFQAGLPKASRRVADPERRFCFSVVISFIAETDGA